MLVAVFFIDTRAYAGLDKEGWSGVECDDSRPIFCEPVRCFGCVESPVVHARVSVCFPIAFAKKVRL